MAAPIGRLRWAIAEGFIPSAGTPRTPALISHETASILNAGDVSARVQITIFHADREPVGPYGTITDSLSGDHPFGPGRLPMCRSTITHLLHGDHTSAVGRSPIC